MAVLALMGHALSNLHKVVQYVMKNEIWKAIAGYEGLYEVSNTGLVRSLNYNHTGGTNILKPGNDRCGYLHVVLFKDGKAKNMFVHRLVADAFIPNPNNIDTVNHKDEDKHNNSESNLEWMTRADNKRYSANKSVQMFDKSTGNLLATFPSTVEAERVTGITHPNISKCCLCKRKSAGGYIWKFPSEL